MYPHVIAFKSDSSYDLLSPSTRLSQPPSPRWIAALHSSSTVNFACVYSVLYCCQQLFSARVAWIMCCVFLVNACVLVLLWTASAAYSYLFAIISSSVHPLCLSVCSLRPCRGQYYDCLTYTVNSHDRSVITASEAPNKVSYVRSPMMSLDVLALVFSVLNPFVFNGHHPYTSVNVSHVM